ncbi:MAG: beta-ketoacyl synthase chain length factor [Enterobacter hormaechei]
MHRWRNCRSADDDRPPLNSGSRLVVDLGLMMRKHRIDAVVYGSRHGSWSAISVFSRPGGRTARFPTDFAMSVHSSAVGNHYRRASACCLFVSFRRYGYLQQSLCDVLSLLRAGYSACCWWISTVCCLIYHAGLPPQARLAYAGAGIEAGNALSCETQPHA